MFIPLYLDEDVDVLLADLVKARGFEATTTRDAGKLENSDPERLAFATSHQQVMLTHNRADFEQLAQQRFAEQKRHAVMMIAVRRPVYELAKRILIILNAVAADEMRNQVRYI